MTVNELISMQIAPDLGYFKKSRELETSLEKTFYNNFMNELEYNDMEVDNLNESVIMPLEDNMKDNLSLMSQNKSELDSVMSQQLDEGGNDNDVNIAGNLQNLNATTGFLGEGFSLFKHDDILNHEGQFGDGSHDILKNLPQFQNFVKAFNQLDKNNILRKPGQKEGKRVKKEEKLFEFNLDNEVKKGDIFGKESKKLAVLNTAAKKEKKKKGKKFYNYDKYSVFKLFTIPNKQIIHYSNRIGEEGQKNIMPSIEDNNCTNIVAQDEGIGMSFNDGGAHDNNSNSDNTHLPNTTFMKYDQEYEKKFGNLYKKFDVRFIKTRLWDSFEKMEVNPNKKEEVEFKSVIGKMTNNLSKNVIDNISTATCFVCFLHLCNEKNLELKQNNDSTFYIEQNIV